LALFWGSLPPKAFQQLSISFKFPGLFLLSVGTFKPLNGAYLASFAAMPCNFLEKTRRFFAENRKF